MSTLITQQYLNIYGAPLAFLRFGQGPRLLIAIPGYGDRANLFQQLEAVLTPYYTVYVLQLPHHGGTIWPRNRFTRADFREAIGQLMVKEQQHRLSFMGYSFGARVLCCLLPDLAGQVDHLFLLAPDGHNRGYIRRATLLPRAVRSLLQRTLSRPGWYVTLAGWLHGVGLLKTYSYRFVQRHMDTEKRRKRLFLYWNSLDDFIYEEKAVASLITQQNISVLLILGKEDRVIPADAWAEWGATTDGVDVYVLEEGHRLFGERLIELMRKLVSKLY